MIETKKNNFSKRHSKIQQLAQENLRFAHRLSAGSVQIRLADSLKALSQDLGLSLRRGDLQLLNNSWYVTHTGLLRLAKRRKCRGIHVEAIDSLCDSSSRRYVLKATVYPTKDSAGFVGYGDADPSNVSALVHGAEMRVAETRAVNRALRKAYGIGTCSIEELGSLSGQVSASPEQRRPSQTESKLSHNGNRTGPKIRDRLCQIIRQHNLSL